MGQASNPNPALPAASRANAVTADSTTCPLCNSARCQIEALAEGYQFCTTMKFVFKTDARGRVIEWATTQHSHPKGLTWHDAQHVMELSLKIRR